MHTKFFKIGQGLLFLVFLILGPMTVSPLCAENLAIWIPNGFVLVNSEGKFITPLFCEGNVETPCAMEEDTLIETNFFDAQGNEVDSLQENGEVELIADVKFCENGVASCFTARNVHFRGHRVPELDSIVRNLILTNFRDAPGFSQTIIAGGKAFQGSMTEHDPVVCDDDCSDGDCITGRFADVVCSGRELKIDFRCEDFVNFETGEFFAYGGGFTISASD